MAQEKPVTRQTVSEGTAQHTAEELSGSSLKRDSDPKPTDEGKVVTLTSEAGTKVTVPEREAEALRSIGYS